MEWGCPPPLSHGTRRCQVGAGAVLMHPGMVYRYPTWIVGLAVIALVLLGAVALEVLARRLYPPEARRRHNDVASAVFSIIGVTYAVLLAFIVMLAWENDTSAKTATWREASCIRAVAWAAMALPAPEASGIHQAVLAYLHAVIDAEWPAQADGKTVDRGTAPLLAINAIVTHFAPSTAGQVNLHAQLLTQAAQLADARQQRLLAADTSIPAIMWVVILLGGALTVGFVSFFGTPSLRAHLAMVGLLGVSGALVVVLVLALSNPFRGDQRVTAAPFERVLIEVGGDVPPL
jgi:hypothetical protein